MTKNAATVPPGPLVRVGPGRPRKQPPGDAAVRIAELAADGWSIVGIAEKLGVAKHTLANWLREHEGLQEALDRGREKERRTLHNVLYRRAVEGDGRESSLAAMYLLNTRHGYRVEQPEGGNRVSITFNLPGAMSREDYMRSVLPPGDDTSDVG